MSSNDELIILEKKKKFYIYHNLCVDNDWEFDKREKPLAIKDNLREAIIFAKDFCNEYPYVEYGYNVIFEGENEE